MGEPTTLLAAAYGVFLLVVAHAVDLLARRAAARTTAWRSGAFVYHEAHDAWLCPEDQWLWPHSFDPDNRVMRYRGSPAVCNACPVRDTCTSSTTGREVTRTVDPWPASESERFHRGIACTIAVLAALWPLGMLLTASSWSDRLLLGGAVAVVVLGGLPLFAHLRRTPANFPEHVPARTLDEEASTRALAEAREARRRTGYRSDRRPVPLPVVDRAAGGSPDPFATRWGAFADPENLPQAGWSRRRSSS